MDNLDIRKKALAQLMGDMDGVEGEGMFPKDGGDMGAGKAGVDVNISITPRSTEDETPEEKEGMDEGMAEGGMVPEPMAEGSDEMRRTLPFMRKAMMKKK